MRTLVVFVKEPRAGQVKSRLGRQIGMIEAAWWYRHQTARLLRRLSPDPRWRLVLAVSPDTALRARAWPAALPRAAQGRGHLGQRMARALRQPGTVLVIGSDIPGIGRAEVAEAFRLLGTHDAVLGPATDGGYWAIGIRAGAALPAGALEGVRWSTAHARTDTEASLAPLRIGHAALLRDVDSAVDLAEAQRWSGRV